MAETMQESRTWSRLGLLAGGGGLPLQVARAEQRHDPFVVELSGFADQDYSGFSSTEIAVGQFGRIIKALKAENCDAVCLCGYVQRPDFKTLKMDAKALSLLPKIISEARKGDDALLRAVVSVFEEAGFSIVGPDAIIASGGGQAELSTRAVAGDHHGDALKAVGIARAIGGLDIGQGAVVARGLVLAVEAQEGTSRMLERVGGLDPALRGAPGDLCGVLAKLPKPIQERRVDLPTVGVETVRLCAEAGLAGIALERGGCLIVEPEAVRDDLDAAGMFLLYVDPADG